MNPYSRCKNPARWLPPGRRYSGGVLLATRGRVPVERSDLILLTRRTRANLEFAAANDLDYA